MRNWNRREMLGGVASGVAVAGLGAGSVGSLQATAREQADGGANRLALVDYQPKSMLQVKENFVSKPKFPVIDFHTHLNFPSEKDGKFDPNPLESVEETLAVMDRKGIALMVNLTGGWGPALTDSINYWQKPHPDRFAVFVQPWFNRIREGGYSRMLADEIEKAASIGAKGVKVLKYLGLGLRERVTEGPLVKIDDPRFDEMWEAAGARKLPVGIHSSDPLAFFLPTDRFNERFEELNAHPDWSFHGHDYPSDRELQEARLRIVQRHPRTPFVALHMGVCEDLTYVAEWLKKYPNLYVEFGARVGELGRQPRLSRRFFEEFQDRILFGTDAVPKGYETPQQIFGDKLYEIYYRFLETADEYFDYAPADVPPQGRWRIYGLELPDAILKQVYYNNSAKLLGMKSL